MTLRPGWARVGMCCSEGHVWTCEFNYSLTKGLFPRNEDDILCPLCGGKDIDPHDPYDPSEDHEKGRIRITMEG